MSCQMVLLLAGAIRRHNYVLELCHSRWFYYHQLGGSSNRPVLELCHSRWFYYPSSPRFAITRCFGIMSFQMVLLQGVKQIRDMWSFGIMSFQMVLLRAFAPDTHSTSFGIMSFQMVLLRESAVRAARPCFGIMSFQMVLLPAACCKD